MTDDELLALFRKTKTAEYADITRKLFSGAAPYDGGSFRSAAEELRADKATATALRAIYEKGRADNALDMAKVESAMGGAGAIAGIVGAEVARLLLRATYAPKPKAVRRRTKR